jgi:hypothetical protein
MNIARRYAWAAVLVSLAVGALAFAALRPGKPAAAPPASAEQPGAAGKEPASPAPPARLCIRVASHDGAAAELLDPVAKPWQRAAPTRVLLNRTPRIYQTEPPSTAPAPACEARGLRAGDRLVLRLEWTDATRDAPAAPPRKTGAGGGEPERLYKQPTGETSAFADAAAIMVPESWSGGPFPSLVMGDRGNPVRLFYWNAARGAEELSAKGRATPAPTGRRFEHRAAYEAGRWTLTAALPVPPDGTPVAFAVWDGATGDRDGLKFFSVWYALTAEQWPRAEGSHECP